MKIFLSIIQNVETSERAIRRSLPKDEGNVEQFNGREGETATLFGTSSVTFYVVVGGFAPRQFNR